MNSQSVDRQHGPSSRVLGRCTLPACWRPALTVPCTWRLTDRRSRQHWRRSLGSRAWAAAAWAAAAASSRRLVAVASCLRRCFHPARRTSSSPSRPSPTSERRRRDPAHRAGEARPASAPSSSRYASSRRRLGAVRWASVAFRASCN